MQLFVMGPAFSRGAFFASGSMGKILQEKYLTFFRCKSMIKTSLKKEVVQSKMSIGSCSDCIDKTTREVADC